MLYFTGPTSDQYKDKVSICRADFLIIDNEIVKDIKDLASAAKLPKDRKEFRYNMLIMMTSLGVDIKI